MRVYQGDSTIPNDPRPHTFVELKKDSFLEVILPKLDTLSEGNKQSLRAFVRTARTKERKENCYHILCANRYFATIYPIPNLRLVGKF